MPHGSISFTNFRSDALPAISELPYRSDYIETDAIGFALAEGRLDALRSMVLLVVREIDALKEMLAPQLFHRKPGVAIDLAKEISEIEKAMIKTALLRTSGNQAAAAKMLSIKTTTLHEKIKRHGIKSAIGS